ncbi:uncharacterized protein LOC144716271 [Wolffia australiana]
MDYYYRERHESEGFREEATPYPAILLVGLVGFLLGLSLLHSVESAVVRAEESINWALVAVPLFIILAIQWFGSFEVPELVAVGDTLSWAVDCVSHEGGSPWAVAAVLLLLLFLASFRSTFRDMWLI